jgi:hypothetical protein
MYLNELKKYLESLGLKVDTRISIKPDLKL